MPGNNNPIPDIIPIDSNTTASTGSSTSVPKPLTDATDATGAAEAVSMLIKLRKNPLDLLKSRLDEEVAACLIAVLSAADAQDTFLFLDGDIFILKASDPEALKLQTSVLESSLYRVRTTCIAKTAQVLPLFTQPGLFIISTGIFNYTLQATLRAKPDVKSAYANLLQAMAIARERQQVFATEEACAAAFDFASSPRGDSFLLEDLIKKNLLNYPDVQAAYKSLDLALRGKLYVSEPKIPASTTFFKEVTAADAPATGGAGTGASSTSDALSGPKPG